MASLAIFPTLRQSQAGAMITKIEDIFESMVDCLSGEKDEMVITLRARGRNGRHHLNDIDGATVDALRGDTHDVTFPGRNPREAWKFNTLVRILEFSHEALVNGTVITKRDLYYRDPDLFMKQSVVDRYVDDLAFTFGVQRQALNIVAAAKGLVAGYLRIQRIDGSCTECHREEEGILIPNMKETDRILGCQANWVLVIEKEATYRALITSRYWKYSAAGHGILITGKGFPDICTRAMVRSISLQLFDTPIYALTDFDPSGVSIMTTYKYGSAALSHENDNLVVPRLERLGVNSADILSSSEQLEDPGNLSLTKRDRTLATNMLRKDVFGQSGPEKKLRRELQIMLMLNVKAEIQCLNVGSSVLELWLDEKLQAISM